MMNDTLISTSRVIAGNYEMQESLNAHPYISANTEDDMGIAARLYSLCLHVLRQVCRQDERGSSSGNSTSMLNEELGKLYLWGQAFGDGKLDRALEYSDEVRSSVLESLADIGRLLLREISPSSVSILESRSFQKPIQELNNLTEQTKEITSNMNKSAAENAGLDDGGSDTDVDDISDDDDMGDIVEELRLQTRWLMELAPALEQNLIHAESTKFHASSPTGVPFSVSGPAATYISLVRDKYRQAETQLVERLGEANWQRHVRVRSRKGPETTYPVEELAIAKSVFQPHSAFHDSGLGTSIPAQTEYTPSHTSFQSSNTEGGHETLRVPATPAEVHEGNPFQCDLCHSILTKIKTRVDWKMHVFSDLQPYICTFTDCEYELVQFSSRAAWAEHEFSKHRNTRLWTCPECPQEFCEVSDWEQHLQERHCLFFSGTNLQVAKNMALKTEAKCTENDECPLCRIVVGKPRRGFVKHVGRHMEEIALKALPPNVEDDTEEGSSSSEHTSLENAVDISAFRQNHIAQGITSETLPEEDKRHIDAKMQSMGHSITPRLSPSRSKDQGQRPFDSKFNESGYIQHCLDERHDLRDNYVDMSDGGNDDQATSSSNDIQSLHSFNYPWQAEAPDPNKPEIEHLERDPPPGVQFARPSYQSSAPMGRGQVNDPSAPLYQITSDVFQGATTEADSDGKFNSRHICNDCNRTFKGWGELRRHAKKHQPDSKLFHCVAADCACSSYRKDKLEDHVRRHHPNLDVVAKTPQSLAHEAPTFQISDAEKELENDFGDSDGTFGGPHPADTNTLKGSGGFTAPNLTKKHLGREPPPE